MNQTILVLAHQPPVGQDLLFHEVSRSNTTTHHNRQEFSGRGISPSQRPLPNNTQHSQQTILAPGGVRTHNLKRPAAADLRFRPRGHWDRPLDHQCVKLIQIAIDIQFIFHGKHTAYLFRGMLMAVLRTHRYIVVCWFIAGMKCYRRWHMCSPVCFIMLYVR